MEARVLTLKNNFGFWSVELAGQSIPLPPNKLERKLDEIDMELRAGQSEARIAGHMLDHSNPDQSCPCCRLEGRVLRGMGRRSISPEEHARAAAHAGSGKVEVRRYAPGMSGAQIAALWAKQERSASQRQTDGKFADKECSQSLAELI